jgi:hypothetical protein
MPFVAAFIAIGALLGWGASKALSSTAGKATPSLPFVRSGVVYALVMGYGGSLQSLQAALQALGFVDVDPKAGITLVTNDNLIYYGVAGWQGAPNQLEMPLPSNVGIVWKSVQPLIAS